VQFVVASRHDPASQHPYLKLARRLDISATEIRQRVATGRSIRYLVPEGVRAIIEANHLYQRSD
jgi:nicotinate-nucleotide adenylyltransferase